MQNKRIFRLLSLPIAAVLVLSLTACSKKSSDTGGNQNTVTSGGTVIYGKVTKIDGSNVTLDIGTLNERTRRTPNGSDQPQNSPSGSPSQQPNSSFEPGQGMEDVLTLSGESKTITISDTSILTMQSRRMDGPEDQAPNASASPRPTMDPSKTPSGNRPNNGGNETEQASLSDISIGSVLKITYQGNTISSIVILNSGASPTGSPIASPSPTEKQ